MNTSGKYLESWVDFLVFLVAVYLLFEGFVGLTEGRQFLIQKLSTEQMVFVESDTKMEKVTEDEGSRNNNSLADYDDVWNRNDN